MFWRSCFWIEEIMENWCEFLHVFFLNHVWRSASINDLKCMRIHSGLRFAINQDFLEYSNYLVLVLWSFGPSASTMCEINEILIKTKMSFLLLSWPDHRAYDVERDTYTKRSRLWENIPHWHSVAEVLWMMFIRYIFKTTELSLFPTFMC